MERHVRAHQPPAEADDPLQADGEPGGYVHLLGVLDRGVRAPVIGYEPIRLGHSLREVVQKTGVALHRPDGVGRVEPVMLQHRPHSHDRPAQDEEQE